MLFGAKARVRNGLFPCGGMDTVIQVVLLLLLSGDSAVFFVQTSDAIFCLWLAQEKGENRDPTPATGWMSLPTSTSLGSPVCSPVLLR